MSTDEQDLDLLLVEPLQLLRNIGTGRVARKNTIIKVAAYEKEVRPVLKCKVDKDVKAVLKVPLSLEPPRTILDRRGVKMIICC